MNRTAAALGAIVLLVGSSPCAAADDRPAAPAAKELAWHTDLAKALQEARDQSKLVFWVQLKGTIDGPT